MSADPEMIDLLLDTLRRYVSERLIPAEEQVMETGEIPADIISEMKEMGLYGISISEEAAIAVSKFIWVT